ncbi:MAG: hypothetical protein ACLFUK_05360 [Halanaerobium sp.]
MNLNLTIPDDIYLAMKIPDKEKCFIKRISFKLISAGNSFFWKSKRTCWIKQMGIS